MYKDIRQYQHLFQPSIIIFIHTSTNILYIYTDTCTLVHICARGYVNLTLVTTSSGKHCYKPIVLLRSNIPPPKRYKLVINKNEEMMEKETKKKKKPTCAEDKSYAIMVH